MTHAHSRVTTFVPVARTLAASVCMHAVAGWVEVMCGVVAMSALADVNVRDAPSICHPPWGLPPLPAHTCQRTATVPCAAHRSHAQQHPQLQAAARSCT